VHEPAPTQSWGLDPFTAMSSRGDGSRVDRLSSDGAASRVEPGEWACGQQTRYVATQLTARCPGPEASAN
jgi:hypothetical protein